VAEEEEESSTLSEGLLMLMLMLPFDGGAENLLSSVEPNTWRKTPQHET
jgi:hypothetical protein